MGAKFWVGSEILGQGEFFGQAQNFGSGVKFWVGSEILGLEQNFLSGFKIHVWAKFHVELGNFVVGVTVWSQGENIL